MNQESDFYARGPGDLSSQASRAARTEDLISVGAITAGLWRNAWILLLAAAVGLGIAYHYAFNVAVPIYQAQASLVLETREQPFVNLQATTSALNRDATSLNTEVAILESRELMGKVVDKLNLLDDPEFNPLSRDPAYEENREALAGRARDLAISLLLAKSDARNLPLTLVFQITVLTTDPVKSALIADTIVDVYIQQQVELKTETTAEAREWLSARIAQLQDDLEAAEGRVEQFRFSTGTNARSGDSVRLERLTSEAGAIRELYQYFLTRLKETSVQVGVQQPDSRVLSYAVEPFSPSAPRKPLLLAVGLAVGLFLGLAIVFVKEATAFGVRDPLDLERLTGASVIGQVPRVHWRHRRSPLKGLIGRHDLLFQEAVNDLRTTLFLSGGAHPPRVVLLTSSVPGEGKTTLSLALAQNLAWREERTLVVDCDMRRRSLSRLAGGNPSKGLLSVLWGGAALSDVVVRKPALNADVLCCEETGLNPVDVFGSKEFHRFLEEAKTSYRTVIIDSSPMQVVLDPLALSKAVDKVLFLVQWKRTPVRKVVESLAMFDLVDTRTAGLVMTHVKRSLLSSSEYESYLKPLAEARRKQRT